MSPGLLHRLRDEALRKRRADQRTNASKSTHSNTSARGGHVLRPYK
jgi:hypothetical protein